MLTGVSPSFFFVCWAKVVAAGATVIYKTRTLKHLVNISTARGGGGGGQPVAEQETTIRPALSSAAAVWLKDWTVDANRLMALLDGPFSLFIFKTVFLLNLLFLFKKTKINVVKWRKRKERKRKRWGVEVSWLCSDWRCFNDAAVGRLFTEVGKNWCIDSNEPSRLHPSLWIRRRQFIPSSERIASAYTHTHTHTKWTKVVMVTCAYRRSTHPTA